MLSSSGQSGKSVRGEADDFSTHSDKDIWDKLSTLSGVIAAVLVPLVIALVGNWYSAALKSREAALGEASFKRDWVQLGISILRDANTNDNTRKWAIDIINSYSDVKMSKNVVEDFVQHGAILPPAAQMAQAPIATTQNTPYSALTLGYSDRVALMDTLQTRGIRNLLDHDFAGALAAYDLAYETWPTFRSVDEIRNILRKASPPQNDQEWKDLYRRISGLDLRGVGQKTRERLSSVIQS